MEDTKKFAREIRINILKMLMNLGFGHYGGSLSCVEVLAVLYNDIMKYNPKNPESPDRDYLVLSKGHAGPALYSALALKGFFPVSELMTLNINGTNLPSHPDRLKTKGVDVTTGSLGQGISIASGIAKALKIQKRDNRVFCIIGDGEAQEGQVWEALQFIAHNKLNNMAIFIDYNKEQLDGSLCEICEPFSFVKKAEAFGFESVIVKGDDVEKIREYSKTISDKPKFIVLDTVKGQGVEFVEKFKGNHHIRTNEKMLESLEKALKELESSDI